LTTTTGRLVWASFGRDRKTVEKFLDLLGPERCEQIKLVSCDDAEWITRPIAERCPQAVICLDPWHIVKAATDALDDVRRQVKRLVRLVPRPAASRWP
jgi:transposase